MFVLGIHNHGKRRHLLAGRPAPPQSVKQNEFAQSFAPMLYVHGQSAQQRGRDKRVFRELLCNVWRKIAKCDRGVRQRVKTGRSLCCTMDQDKRRGDVPAQVLAGAVAKISVQRFNATGKRGAVMAVSKRLNDIVPGRVGVHMEATILR